MAVNYSAPIVTRVVCVAVLPWIALATSACHFGIVAETATCDAGECLDATTSDGTTGHPPPSDAGTTETSSPCVGTKARACASRAGGPASDLVDCENDGGPSASPCATLCLKVPDPYPDLCDPCAMRRDGTYCGRDINLPLADWHVSIACAHGAATSVNGCINGCHEDGGCLR